MKMPTSDGYNGLDIAYLSDAIKQKDAERNSKGAAIVKLAEIKAADPKPVVSALRQRISELEESSGKLWNGKIYGKKGDYNFYINNEKYNATDEEVADRERINAARKKWEEKYKTEIAAAKY